MNKFSYIELAILRMLESGDLHGYAMSAKMREYSEGNLLLPAGSLYPALHKLERAGLIQSDTVGGTGSGAGAAAGRRRRSYALTPKGAAVLACEIESWRVIVKTMNTLLGAA